MDCVLAVRLKPGAARDGVDGWDEDGAGRRILKVRVRARPVEGAANAALIDLLAGRLGLPPSAVTLECGGRGRLKRMRMRGVAAEDVVRRLTDL